MRQHLADGLAAAEAAAVALRTAVAAEAAAAALSPTAMREELAEALDRFDEPRAQAILDRAARPWPPSTRCSSEVILPYLRELGERWARGDASVAHEHFASERPARPAARHRPRLGPRDRPGGSCSPACRASSTTSDCSRSGWPCAHAAGASSTSAPTRRSRRSRTSAAASNPASSSSTAVTSERVAAGPRTDCAGSPDRHRAGARRPRRRQRRLGVRRRAHAHRRPDRRRHARHRARTRRCVAMIAPACFYRRQAGDVTP